MTKEERAIYAKNWYRKNKERIHALKGTGTEKDVLVIAKAIVEAAEIYE